MVITVGFVNDAEQHGEDLLAEVLVHVIGIGGDVEEVSKDLQVGHFFITTCGILGKLYTVVVPSFPLFFS
ncbi:hypothetical protein D3C87_1597990 [compost metagenome]